MIRQFVHDHRDPSEQNLPNQTDQSMDLDIDPEVLHWIVTTSFTGKRELFHQVIVPRINLLPKRSRATPTRVYLCEWCGRIGPARQKNKRFCNDRCRRAFNYRRTGV